MTYSGTILFFTWPLAMIIGCMSITFILFIAAVIVTYEILHEFVKLISKCHINI